jgi:diacylglycerol kinase (ATP)
VSICIIFNPAARGEKAKKFKSYVEKMKGAWVLKPTTGPGVARALASDAVKEGFETIVAAGGDGTLNEVLNGIADMPGGLNRVRMGVLPLGTINVFARELKLPLNVRNIWPVLERGNETRLDVGCAEFQSDGKTVSRHFIQIAGAGFDARAIELVSWELKKKLGPAAYVFAGLQALSSKQPQIEISNGTVTETGEFILIGNGKLYGGSFPLLHKSDLQDGVLDAIVFKNLNWPSLPGHLWDWLSGKLYKPGGSTYLQGATFTLTSQARAVLQLEGELAGELPAKITVLPRALRVLTP